MTTAERAEELYLKYKAALNIQNDMRPGKNPFAIQCAIICVEQVLEWEIGTHCDETSATEYWQEVLSILKKQ